ncbi:MAG: AAA family ATPase [Actinomycetales bacterium]
MPAETTGGPGATPAAETNAATAAGAAADLADVGRATPELTKRGGTDPRDDLARLREAVAMVSTVVVGQHDMVERLMVALLARGHCLLEGVPGVAKTLAARSFATVVAGSFARLQFTPDLVPSDIVGTRIYRPSSEAFDTELGPVFVNVVLADEINRAPAKVQAAMLELMAEHQVSLGGRSYPLPDPFIVIATQNPLESEGVYPLPEAQRDRFLLQVQVPLPRAHEEAEILRRMSVDPPRAQPVLTPEDVLRLRRAADDVYVHPLVADYVVRLVMATREPGQYGLPDLVGVIDAGASPRATLGLLASARALALLRGRDHVLPEDVQALAVDIIAHRLLLGFDAIADGISPRTVVEAVLATVPAPVPVSG